MFKRPTLALMHLSALFSKFLATFFKVPILIPFMLVIYLLCFN